MTTNKPPITFKITLPDTPGATGTVFAERNDLSAMVNFTVGQNDAMQEMYQAIARGVARLILLEQNPPADIKIPEPPKPAASTPKPVTPKPAPAPIRAKWWTNEDTGKVTQNTAKPDKGSWLGPFETEAIANENIPEWLKPMGKKAKK